MPKDSIGKTGNAPIVKVGHTTNGHFGSSPSPTPLTKNPVRELNAK